MQSKASKPIWAFGLTDLHRPVSTADLDEVLRLTSPLVWAGLREQSLFVTGGTGFVGKWLLECMLHADREMGLKMTVSVLTREPARFAQTSPHLANAAAVTLVRGDILDFEFPREKFSAVIHAALPVAPPQAGSGELQRLAEAGARRVCELATASGARRLLHISSGAVYGAQIQARAPSEDAQWNDASTVNDYTQAKRLAEAVVTEDWPFDVSIARCFAFIGPGLQSSSGSAAAQFIEDAVHGNGIVVQGTGEAVRSYQYAGDMARWLVSCLVLGKAGRAYNVGANTAVTIAQLANEITRVADTGEPVCIAGRPTPGLAGNRYVPDVRRAAEELGLRNAVDLEEAIRRTLAWCKAPQALSTASI